MIINMKPYSWFIFAVVGLAIRIYLIEIIYKGENYKDGVFSIFTDLDYKVYLDATQYQSPYERHTYRYSPILSYLVAPAYPDH
jgi:phosphatidylinositol glycan class M